MSALVGDGWSLVGLPAGVLSALFLYQKLKLMLVALRALRWLERDRNRETDSCLLSFDKRAMAQLRQSWLWKDRRKLSPNMP